VDDEYCRVKMVLSGKTAAGYGEITSWLALMDEVTHLSLFNPLHTLTTWDRLDKPLAPHADKAEMG
jgi:hypothetical protein